MYSGIFYDIGNFVPYIIKTLREMRTCAKRNYVVSDRARRKNVPRHILYFFHNSSGYMAGKQQAEDRDKEDNYGLLYRCKAK